jgi:hypothetical protein
MGLLRNDHVGRPSAAGDTVAKVEARVDVRGRVRAVLQSMACAWGRTDTGITH